MRAFLATPLAELAGRQHGVVSGAQLHGLGFSRGQVARMVRACHLIRLYRSVYAVGHARLTAYARWMAAVLSCDGAVLSHTSAAALWDLRRTDSRVIHITSPSPAGVRRTAEITIHRTRNPFEVATKNAIPVTTPSRTILDCAAILSLQDLTRLIEQAEKLRLLDLNELRATPGRKDGANLNAVLAAYTEPDLTRSKLERDMLALCRRHGLPAPQVNVLVEGFTVDFLWADARLIARFTYADVTERPAHVAATLARLLRR